jgi:hypothetical protein
MVSDTSDQPTVFALADRVVLLDDARPCEPAQNDSLPRDPVGGYQLQNRLADDFMCRVAEDALGPHIPRRDDAVEVFADDGVVGRFNDRGEPGCGIQAGILHSHVEC